MKRLVQIFTFLQISLLGCSQSTFDQKLESLLKESVPFAKVDSLPENAVYLDARELEEYEVSHIPGATFIGYKDFNTSALKEISKSDKVIVYCSVGYRSERIGEKLLKLGFTEVYNLYGGIFQWKNSGKIVVTPKGEETEKVHTYNKKWSQWLTSGEKVY